MASFSVGPINAFEGPSKSMKRPTEITCFSFDSNHELHLDGRSLSYYWPPELGANLCNGFETFDQHDDSQDEHLDALLASLTALEQSEDKKRETQFVTWRGMMTKILTAPYSDQDGFSMNATLFQDTIFIEEDHEHKVARKASEQQRNDRVNKRYNDQPSQEMMQYWGYKFESLATIKDRWANVSRADIELRDEQVVSNKAQYCSVVETGIGGNSMIIGGEVDAVWDYKSIDPAEPTKWVELKTSLEFPDSHSPQYHRAVQNFERKLNRFWVQSFLLGVPKIIVGYRSRQGILTDIGEIETMKIPNMVKKGSRVWDGNVCVNFAAAFLSCKLAKDQVYHVNGIELLISQSFAGDNHYAWSLEYSSSGKLATDNRDENITVGYREHPDRRFCGLEGVTTGEVCGPTARMIPSSIPGPWFRGLHQGDLRDPHQNPSLATLTDFIFQHSAVSVRKRLNGLCDLLNVTDRPGPVLAAQVLLLNDTNYVTSRRYYLAVEPVTLSQRGVRTDRPL